MLEDKLMNCSFHH